VAHMQQHVNTVASEPDHYIHILCYFVEYIISNWTTLRLAPSRIHVTEENLAEESGAVDRIAIPRACLALRCGILPIAQRLLAPFLCPTTFLQCS